MLSQSEKVLAHAEQQLLAKGPASSNDLLGLYKKFLKIENHRIRLRHYSGGGGREICGQLATLVDIVLRHLLENALASTRSSGNGNGKHALPKLALVAIGGYGRGELNPFSDIDIMFLHPDSVRQVGGRFSEVIHQILYMLWDVGFKVGHSTRSISEATKQANSDMLSKTSLLEARLIAGDGALFKEFRAEFVKRCVNGYENKYILDRIENQRERHEKFGKTVYMQEPNIKNGCGGLRDYQNLLWIAFFKERVQSTAGLVEKKLLNESERRQLDRAYDFLLRVRTELHYMNDRSADVIVMSQQLQLADKLKYGQKNILRRSEAFMRDYYQHARTIYNMTELLSERLSLAELEMQANTGNRLLRFLGKGKKTTEYFDGFHSIGSVLYADNPNIFTQDSSRLMRVFQHMQQRQLTLSPDVQQLIRRRLHLVDRTFQYSKAAREIFLSILSRKGEVGRTLRAMHQVDFLGRYIPEFGQLTCLVQHEFFHRYTADEHTLVCIEKLDAIIDTAEPKLQEYKKLFQHLENPGILYLALLLHDTGKASNARLHAEASAFYAQKVAARLQILPERRKILIFLVDHHSTLSSIAQRRNLDDAATIAEFAGLVKTQPNLDALMLLTLADGQGVGDSAWSDWKETLVWQLHRNTSLYLADGEAFYRRRQIERESLHETVTSKMAADFHDEIDAHFEMMPDRYFQTHSVAAIIEHIRLFRSFLEGHENAAEPLAPAIRWVPQANKGHTEFWFCGWDRAELLARIAGSLSVAQLNILSADVFTRADNLVLDVFRVCNTTFEAVTSEKDMALVEKKLKLSLAQEQFDFMPLLEKALKRRGYHLSQEIDFPTRIVIDNQAHPVYTLVEIQTPDRLGLLYNLLRAFADMGIQIALSRITTEKGAAIDTFYVTDVDGKKARNDEQLTALQQALWKASQIHAPALQPALPPTKTAERYLYQPPER
jgi:[protein-PII] uridylyltransferase